MSSRRGPLTNNPNVANSPLRGASALAGYAKQKRSYATVQREETYGQPPPLKKQVLDNGVHRPVRSPTRSTRTQVLVQRGVTRPSTKERSSRTASTATTRDIDNEKEAWKRHHRAKFPKMVFYFESIPDDVRARLTKRVNYLGARQEPFFSIAVTHVVTTRSIPPERSEVEPEQDEEHHDEHHESEEQPQTINPSLLNRNTEARRKLLSEFRNAPSRSQQLDDPTKRTRGSRNNDVLHKAREMGKKIWSLDKFQNMLSVLLEGETSHSTYSSRSASTRGHYGTSREPNLLQLLHNERLNGPSDRDPTAVHRELCYFKGPHIYVWDMDEKHKPVMVREYPKVANKADGEWPQFRSVGNGRCPFVEDHDVPDKDHRRQREQEKARAAAKREDPVPILKPPQIPMPKPVTGKRTITEMEDGQNRARAATPTEVFNPAKAVMSKQADARQQNAFTSRAGTGRLFAGEPVASGVQPSNITSAIRSQMISSTSGVNGAKAGTSKEVHGLQRKVLQKAAPASFDVSSRRLAEVSMDVASSRSTTMGRHTSRPAEVQEEEAQKTERRAQSQSLKSKRDLKPGYCENCQDKFRDFDEHILSRKHRKFAENDDNWTELDALLSQIKRMPKYAPGSDEEEVW
ncbi:Cdc7p-Dbf4p kinase complex regulatory subunit [Fusarium torreyae]|uniref:Cdc7p-Dbf4p kinase complex regulatory subunit n=1 Tax=Fusarium torreyae TaxID=1237075 RepID=A0A9W8S703_9HYPO|nr:Cdc7p-Dbf4p kinase complex regulatory subunit [Fusarium torreyae]